VQHAHSAVTLAQFLAVRTVDHRGAFRPHGQPGDPRRHVEPDPRQEHQRQQPPAATYAQEIAHAFRLACLSSMWKDDYYADDDTIPLYYAPILGFASHKDMMAFCRQHAAAHRPIIQTETTTTTQVVSFLEIRLTASTPLSSSAAMGSS